MVSIIHLFLGQDGSIGIIWNIGFHLELLIQIGVHENGSLTDSPFEEFKSTWEPDWLTIWGVQKHHAHSQSIAKADSSGKGHAAAVWCQWS